MAKKVINLSQMKRARQDKKINVGNRRKRKQVKVALKTAKVSKTPADINKAVQTVDSMASKGIISVNKASREKSRLMRMNATAKAPAAK